jgi:hypothetical protein
MEDGRQVVNPLVEVLGEELANAVQAKLPEGKPFRLVEDGTFIPKSRFDEVNNRYKETQSALQERDSKIAELTQKASSVEELRLALDKTEQNYKTRISEIENTYQTRERELVIDTALNKANARNPKAVKSLLDFTKIQVENGQVNGLNEQLTELMKTDGYLFDAGVPLKAGNTSGGNNIIGNDPFDEQMRKAMKLPPKK